MAKGKRKSTWISTKVVYEWATGKILHEEGYEYDGPLALAHAQPSLDAVQFQWFDVGTESGSVARQTAGTDDSVTVAATGTTPLFIRFLIQEVNGGVSNNTTGVLEYSLNGNATYATVTGSTPIRSVTVAEVADGDNTTHRIGSGVFISPNAGVGETVAGTLDAGPTTFTGNDEVEWLYVVAIDNATVNDGDTIDVRPAGMNAYSMGSARAGAARITISKTVTRTGDLAVTDGGPDTFAGTGDLLIQGDLAATDSSDTFAGTGALDIQGDLAATEGGADTFAGDGSILGETTGDLAATDGGPDTFAGTGALDIQGDLAATESSDTFAGTGSLDIVGDLAATDGGPDTFAGTGVLRIQGNLAATDGGADTFAGDGDLLIAGDLSVTEPASDTFSGTGELFIEGDLAATEGSADTFAGTGSIGDNRTGNLAATEQGADTFAGTGTLPLTGDLAASEPSDTFAGTGDLEIGGDLSASEGGADSFSGVGKLQITGNLAVVGDGPDIFAGTGALEIQGDLSATDGGPDTFAGDGILSPLPITGDLAATEAGADTFVGFAGNPIAKVARIWDGSQWVQVGLGEAPEDGVTYGRNNAQWSDTIDGGFF